MGLRQSVPGYDASYRPGDNLYTASALAFNAGTARSPGISVHAQRNHDYDETGTPHPDRRQGETARTARSSPTPAATAFNYVFDRGSGQFLNAAHTPR